MVLILTNVLSGMLQINVINLCFEVCDKLEADIRRNAYKLMSSQARAAAKAAGRAVDISAEDFEDADS